MSKKKLEWFAFYQDLNSTKLVYTNVLTDDLIQEIKTRIKSTSKFRKISNYLELREALKSYFMWRYSSKSEYEVIVSNWSGKDFKQKIDIWFQLEPNLDRITEYIIKELKLEW